MVDGLQIGHSGTKRFGLSQFRQAKIENLHSPVVKHEDVVRLQIAVDNAFFVSCRQSPCDLHGVINGFALWQRSAIHVLA